MLTNETIKSWWDEILLTTRGTNADKAVENLLNIIHTMTAISELGDKITYIKVEEQDLTNPDKPEIETVRYPLNDYVLDRAFSMFIQPRAVKIEVSSMWANLKSSTSKAIEITDGKILSPDAFAMAQISVLGSIARKFNPTLRMGDATLPKSLAQMTTLAIDGRINCDTSKVAELPFFLKDEYKGIVDSTFIATITEAAHTDRLKMRFVQDLSLFNGGTNKTRSSKFNGKPKSNSHLASNSANTKGADQNASEDKST